jgi:glutathione S-transferase
MAAAKLYGLSFSHPTMCARLALEHKGVETDVVNVMPGMHPVAVRGLGFRRNTVPAVKIDGTRVQGSREINAYLERTRPEPPLYGTEPEERRQIEEAETWGERELQPIPRRIFRLAATKDPAVLEFIGKEAGLPAPALMARLSKPVAILLARSEGATDETVRDALQSMDAKLDAVDALIADGTIGGTEPNAADLQILTTIRSMMSLTDLEPFLAGRPCVAAAERLVPEMPGPVPPLVPEEWLAEAAPARQAT